MSRRTSGKSTVEKPGEAAAFYVYCIGFVNEVGPVINAREGLPPPIEPTGRLETIGAAEIAAVVSAVPLADYGEGALEERLADPAWLAARAMRHERVVEHFARRASTIPLRFGTIYLSPGRVREMLDEKWNEFNATLGRLRGREEWGVNLYADRARLREAVVELSPRLRGLAEQAAAATPGQGYLLRKKIEAARADEARAEARRASREVEETLAAEAEGAVRLRVRRDESGEHGDVAAKLAFLVARERFSGFREAAERLAERLAPAGFRLELTGPWPAYNFAAPERGDN